MAMFKIPDVVLDSFCISATAISKGFYAATLEPHLRQVCMVHTLHFCFCSRELSCVGHVARTWEKRNAYRVLVRKPEVEEHFKPRCMDGINMNWKEERQDRKGVVWNKLTWHRGKCQAAGDDPSSCTKWEGIFWLAAVIVISPKGSFSTE
jgi:hypothetical protein